MDHPLRTVLSEGLKKVQPNEMTILRAVHCGHKRTSLVNTEEYHGSTETCFFICPERERGRTSVPTGRQRGSGYLVAQVRKL